MYTKEQIIAKLGIGGADPQLQQQALQDVANAVSNRILLAISKQLSEKDLMEVSILLDSDKEEEAEKLLNKKIPNYDDFRIRIEQETIDGLAQNTEAVAAQAEAIQSENLPS